MVEVLVSFVSWLCIVRLLGDFKNAQDWPDQWTTNTRILTSSQLNDSESPALWFLIYFTASMLSCLAELSVRNYAKVRVVTAQQQ